MGWVLQSSRTRFCWVVFLLTIGVTTGCRKPAPQARLPEPPKVDVAVPVSQTVTDFEEYTGRLAPV